MTTIVYAGELVVTSCWCGIFLAIPRDLYQAARRDHAKNVYCPLGHSFVYTGKTEADQLRASLRWEQDRAAALLAERDGARASLRATRGVVTKLRKRATAGACPFGCRRHFADLERHVAIKHIGETLEGELP